MKREDITKIFEGATKEQIDAVLDLNSADIKMLKLYHLKIDFLTKILLYKSNYPTKRKLLLYNLYTYAHFKALMPVKSNIKWSQNAFLG